MEHDRRRRQAVPRFVRGKGLHDSASRPTQLAEESAHQVSLPCSSAFGVLSWLHLLLLAMKSCARCIPHPQSLVRFVHIVDGGRGASPEITHAAFIWREWPRLYIYPMDNADARTVFWRTMHIQVIAIISRSPYIGGGNQRHQGPNFCYPC